MGRIRAFSNYAGRGFFTTAATESEAENEQAWSRLDLELEGGLTF